MPDPYTRQQKQVRFDRLLDTQNRISAEKHAEYVGKTVRVLTDGLADGETTSRTGGGRLVRIKGEQPLGQYMNVKITGSTTWALFGEAAE